MHVAMDVNDLMAVVCDLSNSLSLLVCLYSLYY